MISGDVDVAGRPESMESISVEDDVNAKNGSYSMVFAIPKRPEFTSGKYVIEIGCYAREQTPAIEALFGHSGEHFSGPHAVTDKDLGITSLEIKEPFNAHGIKPAHYAMVSPSLYSKNSPKWAFAHFMQAWKERNWSDMTKYTDRGWQIDNPNSTQSLSSDFGDTLLLGAAITEAKQDKTCHAHITCRVTLAAGSHMQTRLIEVDLSRETPSGAADVNGQWGVYPKGSMSYVDMK